jgi:hypothetical protein
LIKFTKIAIHQKKKKKKKQRERELPKVSKQEKCKAGKVANVVV